MSLTLTMWLNAVYESSLTPACIFARALTVISLQPNASTSLVQAGFSTASTAMAHTSYFYGIAGLWTAFLTVVRVRGFVTTWCGLRPSRHDPVG